MITATTTIHEISKTEITKMLAKELGVDPSKLTVDFPIDSDSWGVGSYPVCKKVTVTVKY